jgi:hypothetical protein
MSFSVKVKNELCRLAVPHHFHARTELFGFAQTLDLAWEEGDFVFVTENAATARRFYSLLKMVEPEGLNLEVERQVYKKRHSIYQFDFHSDNLRDQLVHPPAYERSGEYRDFLRGAFLGAGSISDPEKTYHLEIVTQNQAQGKRLEIAMEHFNLKPKQITRKEHTVVYLKEGEQISDFLTIVGATVAMMAFENIRVVKEMRNNVNRLVNCETANLSKTINASVDQQRAIEMIERNRAWDDLPNHLKELAELRMAYPEASLRELGEMLQPPIGKSGVNHRLKKLMQIADELHEKEEEKC